MLTFAAGPARCFGSFSSSVSRRLAARSRISAIFATNWWCAGDGSTKPATPIWWRCASSCRDRLPARSAFPSASCAATVLSAALAAWFAFTMPSALILFAFATGAAAFKGPVAEGFLHGLKLVAVAVVAQAIWGMARTLAPDRGRAGIALAAVAIVVFFAGRRRRSPRSRSGPARVFGSAAERSRR